MPKTIVGLELTEECVRGVEITLGRVPQLRSYGEVPLPPDAAKDSEVLDAGTVAVALRQLWTGARFQSKDVVLGVASRRILLREYTTQAMRPDLLRDALPYQVQDLLPVPASQAVLDFFPLTQAGDQVSGLLVAAVSDPIEQIIGTLDRVKLRARAIDLTAFGLARATARISSPDEVIATAFIGDHTTQVVVARGGVPVFVRILPMDVPTAASQRHLIGDEQLDPALESLAGAAAPTTRARGAMRAGGSNPVLSDLAARLRSTLSFYSSRPEATPPSRLYVTGAGAAVPGMMAAIDAVIATPTQVVSVSDIIGSPSVISGELGLNLVSTVGIALGEAR